MFKKILASILVVSVASPALAKSVYINEATGDVTAYEATLDNENMNKTEKVVDLWTGLKWLGQKTKVGFKKATRATLKVTRAVGNGTVRVVKKIAKFTVKAADVTVDTTKDVAKAVFVTAPKYFVNTVVVEHIYGNILKPIYQEGLKPVGVAIGKGVYKGLVFVFVEDTDREDKVAVYEVSSEEELIEISNQLKAELVIEHPLDQDTEAYIKSEAR